MADAFPPPHAICLMRSFSLSRFIADFWQSSCDTAQWCRYHRLLPQCAVQHHGRQRSSLVDFNENEGARDAGSCVVGQIESIYMTFDRRALLTVEGLGTSIQFRVNRRIIRSVCEFYR